MLFRLSEVSKSYGAQEVLRSVSFQVNPGEHIGLVGRNGAGKTTILRIVSEVESPDTGIFETMRGLRFGVLNQHVDFGPEDTVLDSALSVFAKLLELERKMRELEHQMTEVQGEALDTVLHQYSEAQAAYEQADGFTYHARAESVLQGLGFAKEDFGKPAGLLSGGEKNRLGMVRMLLLEPDILLLDEPTNHLDVQAVEWLEDFLSEYKSAYIIISHDRFFLDHTVNRILDLENGRLESYTGNYSKYQVLREERRELQLKAFEQQQEMIARTEDFIRRNIAGQKTKQAKSRRKMLDKVERLENIAFQETAKFGLKPTARTGDQVLILDRVAVGFPTRRLAEGITATVKRGERLGIIGANGTGKTTLLRTLLGEQHQLDGEIRWGSGVAPGYYDQRLSMIDLRNTVLDEIRTVAASTVTDGEMRSFLGRFLFSGDDVFKTVDVLSGGEKGRLALAKLIYSRVNVLILDEPTNHLDIASCEALEDALNEYDGTIITVSHDRYFLDRIATKILFFGSDGVEYFDGGYTEFYDSHHKAKQLAVEAIKAAAAPVVAKSPKETPKKKKGPKGPTPEEIEGEIQRLEEELRTISAKMSLEETARDKELLLRLSQEYSELEEKLSEMFENWEKALAAG